jgi:hypothetical protein
MHPAAADGVFWDKLERDVIAEKLRETAVAVGEVIVRNPDLPLDEASVILDSALHKTLKFYVAAGAVDTYQIGLALDENTRAVIARVVFRLREGGAQGQTVLRLNCRVPSPPAGPSL